MDNDSGIKSRIEVVAAAMLVVAICSGFSGYPGVLGQSSRTLPEPDRTAIIEGVLIDIFGNVVQDVSMIVANAASGVFIDTLVLDNRGSFKSYVPPGQYTLESIIHTAQSAQDVDPPGNIGVSAGDSISIVLNTKHGRGMIIYDVQFNHSEPFLKCAGNTEISVSYTYQIWAPYALPLGDEHISVGIGPEALGVCRIGTPGSFPGVSGRDTILVQAPESPGRYSLYAHQSSLSDNTDAAIAYYYRRQWNMSTLPSSAFLHLFVPIGTIEVTPPAGVISGQIGGRKGTSDGPIMVSSLSPPSGRVIDSVVIPDTRMYEMRLPDGEYEIRCEQVTKSASYLLATQANINVSGTDSVKCDLDFTDCTSITLHSAVMGDSDTGIEAEPGELVELSCDYELHVGSDQQDRNQYIAVGIDGVPSDGTLIRRLGSESDVSGNMRIRVQAPPEDGTYQVYALLVNGFMTRDALDAYSDRFEDVDFCYIRIGAITVR